MKKIYLKFMHLSLFSAMLILVGCTQQIRHNDKLESQKLSYQVSSESLGKIDNIGTYMIEYDIDMKKIIETSGEKIECRKIKHIGIFNTTYWLNKNSQN
ncbi:hypothetical protein [Anaerotignum sp.]|uniref:hypothetical protein n=1 Tax=Anaerotignum sp. TaxID=2039241 RepID=UPI002714EDF6|nr:hypothetical protein [Anaerotignum sp.]